MNIIKNIYKTTLLMALICGMGTVTSCQDKDIDVAPMAIEAPDASTITGQLSGYDYTLTWPQPAAGQTMNVAVYRGGSMIVASEAQSTNHYTFQNTETGAEYWFVFRLSDGTNQSEGTLVRYVRPGASKAQNLAMKQVENADGTNQINVTWDAVSDANNYEFTATNGSKVFTETLDASASSYTIKPVSFGDTWDVSIVATNSGGKALPATASLLVGKTKLGFLSEYATESDLLAKGDDDEASAWLWFKAAYPDAKYIYFGDIKSEDDIEPYRMLFFMRDIETGNADDVWNFSTAATNAAPYIGAWAKAGGNLLLWSHAVPYIGYIGRLDLTMLKSVSNSIGCGKGGINNDVWKMGASVNTGKFSKDYTTHAIYKGITPEYNESGIALIACKGAGWTEDHNCLFFDIPTKLTGYDNNTEDCYKSLTTEYGIYPLGTWDSQVGYVSQLNVWEATTGTKTDYKGTCLCIGNGGLEFSMKNADGTYDISAKPTNNAYQATILKIARNCVDYLMSK